jgi:predicted nucleic acid-binding protein
VTALVVDASVALSWCFDDEASSKTDELLERVQNAGAIVPSLWHLELGNILLLAERHGRVILGGISARLELLAQLPVTVDTETTGRAWRETLILARSERLTTYDAAYLELAARRGVPLATRDRQLLDAARRIGVESAL